MNSGTFRGFKTTQSDSTSTAASVMAVKIDGKILVDSGVTPPNVPSIGSTVRANPSAGLSITSWTGTGANATIGHGLNAAPEFVIVKTRDSSVNWTVWHKAIAATDYLTLNTSNAKGTAASVWNSAAPTSSVINVGTDVGTNKSGDDYVAHVFSGVEGYSAFGSYEGNGTIKPFVFTGFRPRFVMIKCINDNSYAHWYMFDTSRSPHNVVSDESGLAANLSDFEGGLGGWNSNGPGDDALDILSNGFKMKLNSTGGLNDNGDTYLFAAFAEHPFQSARAR
jgi:hypothetical protein